MEVSRDSLGLTLSNCKDLTFVLEKEIGGELGAWQNAKRDEKWRDFEVGDIVDLIDSPTWFEGVVKRVSDSWIFVSYVGWSEKYV